MTNLNDKLPEIEPCPFCGNANEVEAFEIGVGDEDAYECYVFCGECNATGPNANAWRGDAIEAWNRSATPAPQAAPSALHALKFARLALTFKAPTDVQRKTAIRVIDEAISAAPLTQAAPTDAHMYEDRPADDLARAGEAFERDVYAILKGASPKRIDEPADVIAARASTCTDISSMSCVSAGMTREQAIDVVRGVFKKEAAAPVTQEVMSDEFCEGQWWLQELDTMAALIDATPDQKLAAYGVARNLLRQFNKLRATTLLNATTAPKQPE